MHSILLPKCGRNLDSERLHVLVLLHLFQSSYDYGEVRRINNWNQGESIYEVYKNWNLNS